jgi:imidazolonepropionase-like amidohydrolase
MKTIIIVLVTSAAFGLSAAASDNVPGKPQQEPILLTGADVYPVSGPAIPAGQLLFDKGKIVAVGKDVNAPSEARRIDLTGKRIYPGLFAAGSDLGLREIPSVRGTIDSAETGTINPNARAEVAINPDSELIPVARANGVLLNLTVPDGGLLTGSSAVIQLDGWTWEDLTVKAPAAIHLEWPRMTPSGLRRGGAATGEETSPAASRGDEQLGAIDKVFSDARAYLAAKKAASPSSPGRHQDFDARWDAMVPLLEGKIPLVVAADEVRQIEAAVAFAARQNVRLVISGGFDAPLAADLLKKHDVPVIVNGIQRLPLRRDDPYDSPFTLPQRLHQAGIRFCITLGARHGASEARNLPYHAAVAAAYGLPVDEALKSITLYPAQILGVADRVGSLDNGKDATLIVTTGDVLEETSNVELAFVQGRQVDLSSKHTRLWEKYREKYRRQGNGKAVAGEGAQPNIKG